MSYSILLIPRLFLYGNAKLTFTLIAFYLVVLLIYKIFLRKEVNLFIFFLFIAAYIVLSFYILIRTSGGYSGFAVVVAALIVYLAIAISFLTKFFKSVIAHKFRGQIGF